MPSGAENRMISNSSIPEKAVRITLIASLYLVFILAATNVAVAQATGMQGDAAWNEYRTAGERTASGESFDPRSMTAASNDLPFDSLVRITRVDNGKTIVVRINDRTAGDEHIIHLSDAAASHLGVPMGKSTLIQLNPLGVESLTVLRRPGRVLRTGRRRSGDRTTKVSLADVKNPDKEANHAESLQSVRLKKDLSLRFTLQVGVFSSRESAYSFSGELSESWILPVTVDGKALFRVYFSRFSEESPARVAQKDLERQGRDSFLRTI